MQKPPDRRSGEDVASLIPLTGMKFLSGYKHFQPDSRKGDFFSKQLISK
jgi:hypothetical protein